MPLRDGSCDECGFYEWPGPGIAVRHRRLHAEWRDGAELRPVATDRVVARLTDPAGVEILEITPSSPTVQQKRAERVVSAANRYHLRYDGPQYEAHETDNYPSNAEYGTRVYVARLKGRGGGFVLLRRRSAYWELTWTDYAEGRNPGAPVASPTRWCVDLVWVRAGLRRRGVASSLIRIAAERLEIEARDFAWGGPFKPDGEALARVLSPNIVRMT